MKKIFNGRNVAIAVITLAIGVFAAFGAAKVFFNRTTTVTGNAVSFMLNPEGKVDGVILDTGDQIKFGPETGDVVTAKLQIGSALTATGHAGTSSNYGREFHAESLQIGDQTIKISGRPEGPKGDKPHGPRPPKGDRPDPREGKRPAPPAPPADSNDVAPLPPVNAPETAAPQAETTKISGNVKYVLVNREGEPRGLVLATGEQLNLGKEVEDSKLSFDANTNISAEGEVSKSQFGTFVKAKVLTIGNQTFTFNR